jgi:non-ribosomal peptide synthetase component F
MAYWLEQLGGDLRPAELALPLDKPRPDIPTYQGGWLSQSVTAEQLAALKALARAEGTTLFVVLLAAFKTLLYRYSGQEDILIGSPVTNRIQHELENVIGHFINTLVIRTDLSGPLTFRQLLQRQKQVVLDAYSNQDIPLNIY